MNNEQIVAKINESMEIMAKLGIGGIPLEQCSPFHLTVSVSDFNEHVDMQPGAIVYFGNLFKEAKRNYEYEKKFYERWKKIKLSDARRRAVGNKPTIAEVETQYLIDNKEEIEAYEKKIFELKGFLDTLESWYEGWKQKGFSLNLRAGLISDEMGTHGVLLTGEDKKFPVTNALETQKNGNPKKLKLFMQDYQQKKGKD